MKLSKETNQDLLGKAAMLYVKFQIFLISFGILGAVLASCSK
jgi:hypothetical protein